MEKLLKEYFGYDQFRPLQKDIINNVLGKKDAFVLMPTGGGKSLCYQLPALVFDGVTLVISPLISLMKDQVDALKANGIAAAYINSSLTYAQIFQIQYDVRIGKIKILYLAPERLALDTFQEFLQEIKVSFIAVDEAHCISEWGHDFRPEYRNLKLLKGQFPNIPLMALTATATPKVQQDIITQLSLADSKKYVSSFDRANLVFRVVNKRKAFDKIVGLLRKYKNESAIIYCFSRKDTEAIALDLKGEGFNALPYHAGLTNEARKAHQEMFIKDEVAIIVATIAFGMGIDKPDVRLVVHYSFPKTLEGYYQEVGRAGRDGLESECVLFYSYGDKIKHEFFINQVEDIDQQEMARTKLSQVMDYCERTLCRRKYVLDYFGEVYPKENCEGCDICLGLQNTFDATNITRKILACVVNTGNRFGRKHIVDVLRGRNTARIRDCQHDSISVFGIVKDYGDDALKYIIQQLLEHQFLQKAEGLYPTLEVTDKAAQWIHQKQNLELFQYSIVEDNESKSGSKDNVIDGDYDLSLFEQLRHLRKRIADQKGVPPFVIFGDVSLREMAHYFPANRESFSRIKGVGAKKLERLGDIFLSEINSYCKLHGKLSIEVPERAPKRTGRVQSEARKTDSRYGKTKQMVFQKISLSEMADAHGFTEQTILNHIEKLIEAKEKLDIEYLKGSQERFGRVGEAFEKCGYERLKPVYELLEGQYSYAEIQLVRLVIKNGS